MQAILINGSPRDNGNTAHILTTMQAVLENVGGWNIEAIHLNKLTMKGCQGCMSCKNKTDHCVVRDDLTTVYEKILASDVIILGTPLFFYDVTGQFKLFFDRFFAFWDRTYTPRVPPGKTVVFVMPQGQDNLNLGLAAAGRYAQFLKAFGFSNVEELVLPGMKSRIAASKNKEYTERARILAEKLAWGYAGTVE